jgi:hypothetical protein
MASFIRLLLAATETGVLINTDNVTCILPEGSGSRIFFVADEDTVDVATPFAELSAMLVTGDATTVAKDNATPTDAAPATPTDAVPKIAPATSATPASAGGTRARPVTESPAPSPATPASKTDVRPR